MKRGTPEHPKVHALAALLNVPRYAAVGILESLWHFAQEYAPSGDIGRFPDDAIARWVCWDGASTVLIEALNQSEWIDRCDCHRLRIHDWPDHADQTVRRVLDNRGQQLLACYDDPSTALAPSQLPCRAVAVPSRANTNTTESSPAVEETTRLYCMVLDAVFHRRTTVRGDDITAKIKQRLKSCTREMIVSTPLLVAAQKAWTLPTKPLPIHFLRDGEHPKVRDGQTYGAKNWIARSCESIDGTVLDSRLSEIARQAGVLDWLLERGAVLAEEAIA